MNSEIDFHTVGWILESFNKYDDERGYNKTRQ